MMGELAGGKTKNEMCSIWLPEKVNCNGLILCIIWGRTLSLRVETQTGEDKGNISVDIC